MKSSDITPPRLGVLGQYLEALPPLIARKRVEHFLGGIISRKTLSNDDAAGCGPRVRLKIGEDVAYPREYLLDYLEHKGVQRIVTPEL